MKISQARYELDVVDKHIMSTPCKCEKCPTITKTLYETPESPHNKEDTIYICGKCLVRFAAIWKEHTDNGGV